MRINQNGPSVDTSQMNVKESYIQPSFILGFIPMDKPLNIAQVCDVQKPIQMTSEMSMLDVTLTIVTMGLYTPHHVVVECSSQTTKEAPAPKAL